MTDNQRLQHALEIALDAGEQIRAARHGRDFGHRYKGGEELVTDIDVAVDRRIGERLEAIFPGEARLSEELAPDRSALAVEGPLWVVDPIDGTVNFAHGLAHVAVSIAWLEHGQARIGVVHAPFLGETYTAIHGEGAWRNGETIHASRRQDLSRSLVATGFPTAATADRHRCAAWPRCSITARMCAATAPRHSTCATSPADDWTPTTRASRRGTSRPAG